MRLHVRFEHDFFFAAQRAVRRIGKIFYKTPPFFDFLGIAALFGDIFKRGFV